MSTSPVVGSAFIELHARAASNLEGEIRRETEQATARVAGGAGVATEGSIAEARQQLAIWKRELENVDTGDLEKVRDLSSEVAGWQTTLTERTALAGGGLKDLGASGAGALVPLSAAASAAAAGVTAVAGAVAFTVSQFQKLGERRILSPEDQGIADALTGQFSRLGDETEELAGTLGAVFAPAVLDSIQTLNSLFGVLNDHQGAVQLVVGAVSDVVNPLGAAREAWDEFRGTTEEASETIEGLTDSVTLLTAAQEQNNFETERATRIHDEAAKVFDARVDASVRALEADLAIAASADNIAAAQDRLNRLQSDAVGSASRVAQAQDKVADSYRAVREALEALDDRNQDALEKERDLADARRDLAETSFRTGSQSEDTSDAADKVQSLEHDVARARQEVADQADDVRVKEGDLATARAEQHRASVTQAAELVAAQRDVDAAVRDAAKAQADYRVAAFQAGGGSVEARDKLSIYREELEKLSKQAGPEVRAEIDRITAALAALPQLATVAADQAIAALSKPAQALQAARDLATTDFATGARLPGVGAASVQITNVFNTPVDPAQIAREQAAQISGAGVPTRVI